MTAHDIAERARLLSHTRYAEIVDADQPLITQARRLLECGDQQALTTGQLAWRALLKLQWNEIRSQMLRDDPQGRLLRSNSPFSIILGETDPDQRRQSWRQAKFELSNRKI